MINDRKQAFEKFARAAQELGEADGFKEAIEEWKKDRSASRPTKRNTKKMKVQ